MVSIKRFLYENLWFFLAFLVFIFLSLHFFGVHLPYHQDEYKWVLYSHPEIIAPGTVPHTPLTELIYTKVGPLVGDLNFRFIPFFFGFCNLFLIFYLTKIVFDKKTALIVASLFTISFYSLLASLMVDVDGAVMPFFLLLMFIGYYQLKKINFQFQISNFKNISWLMLLFLGALGGFLIKVIFAIAIAVLALDFAIEKKVFSEKRKLLKAIVFAFLGVIGLILILLLAKFIFPFFRLEYAFKYWEHFANFGVRNWFQTFIQFIKAVLYTSPLLILPLFFVSREVFIKWRPFFIFLFVEIIFYLFIFDFSTGALDRYFQFMVIPLCVISGTIIASILQTKNYKRNKEYILLGSAISLILLFMVFIPHFVPSLIPKSAWISRVYGFQWNFLFPFFGGSGPLGFYVSFLFIVLSWIVSFVLVIFAFVKPHFRKMAILILLPIGFIYNGVFIEEYLFGAVNGSAPKLLSGALEFVKNSPKIDEVIVYNDNGGYGFQNINKYKRRLYLDPMFVGQIDYMNDNKGYYFVLDVPRIDEKSLFVKYFNSCDVMYKKTDKAMSAVVYDCKGIKDVK